MKTKKESNNPANPYRTWQGTRVRTVAETQYSFNTLAKRQGDPNKEGGGGGKGEGGRREGRGREGKASEGVGREWVEGGSKRERERDRHRERQRERQTDRERQRQRETETETERQRQRDRQTDRQTETERQRQTDRQTDRQRQKQSGCAEKTYKNGGRRKGRQKVKKEVEGGRGGLATNNER